MPLTAQRLEQFPEEGHLFLPGCFSEREVAILRDEAERIYASDRQRSSARRPGRRAPPLPLTPTARRSAYWAPIHG